VLPQVQCYHNSPRYLASEKTSAYSVVLDLTYPAAKAGKAPMEQEGKDSHFEYKENTDENYGCG